MDEKIIKNGKEIKSHFLKIDGRSLKINFDPNDCDFEDGHTYPVAIMVDITGDGTDDNFDGTHNRTVKAKCNGQIKVYDSGKTKTVKLSIDKRKNSQLFRGQIINCGYDYEETMPIIRHLFAPHIIQLIEKYKKGEIE